jgi:hypothetical protein
MTETARDHFDALAAALGPRAARQVPLGPLTTYGVGGPAAVLVEIEGPDDLPAVRAVLAGSGAPVCVIGRGSNLLVADAGFAGVAVHLGRGFNRVRLPAPAGDGRSASGTSPSGPSASGTSPSGPSASGTSPSGPSTSASSMSGP